MSLDRLYALEQTVRRRIKKLTSKPTCIPQFRTEGIFTVDVEIIAHEPSIAKETKASTFLPPCQNLVPIFSDFGVLDALFVVLPETLDSLGAFVLVSPIISPSPLDASGHVMPVTVTHRFQRKELR
jgi:hypothetical protein